MGAGTAVVPGGRRPRNPGIVYAALATALIVVLTTIALTTRQPPPPTIAEFAPQAIERIEDAPDEQSSQEGFADGPGGSGGVPSPPPIREEVEVARVRRCVGNPPRQIEDPQSPPCVPFWRGDNGGATFRGVTRTEVRIVIPTCEGRRTNWYQALERFFNSRFEFYGRQVRFICARESNGTADETMQKAEARGDFEMHKPFGASKYFSGTGKAYSSEIARLGVVSVTNAILNTPDPLLWSYWMGANDMFASLADWACRRLVGRRAVHAGQDELRSKTRAFGIIIETGYSDDNTTPSVLERGLEACGGRVVEKSINEFESQTEYSEIATVMLRMKQAGVTSIFCFCHLYHFGPSQVTASNQAYFPEWLISTYGGADLNGFIKLGGSPPEQMEHTFGVSFQPRQIPLAQEPWWWGVREGDPSISEQNTTTTVEAGLGVYRPLLVLAAGIQMAGPNLTPETFERGLERAAFPNPVHPNKPGAVGFRQGTHGMMLDGTEIWWSNSAQGPFEDSPGTYCNVEGGRRHRVGEWPKGGDPFFSGRCFSGRS